MHEIQVYCLEHKEALVTLIMYFQGILLGYVAGRINGYTKGFRAGRFHKLIEAFK